MKSSTKIKIMQGVLRHAVVLLLVWLGTLAPAPYALGELTNLTPTAMWGALGFAMGMGVVGVVLADWILQRVLGQSASEALMALAGGQGGKARRKGGTSGSRGGTQKVEEYDGVVIRYNAEKGYGFLQAPGLREEPFFHRNDVSGIPLEHLRPGLGVRFAAFLGPKGMRAQKIWISSD